MFLSFNGKTAARIQDFNILYSKLRSLRDFKDFRVFRDLKDSKDFKDSKVIRVAKDLRDFRDPKDLKDPNPLIKKSDKEGIDKKEFVNLQVRRIFKQLLNPYCDGI